MIKIIAYANESTNVSAKPSADVDVLMWYAWSCSASSLANAVGKVHKCCVTN